MTLLDVTSLSIGYQTRSGLFLAAKEISFSLDAGRSLGLMGESGCGKTTIGMGLLRLLPANASFVSGSILFNGEDLIEASGQRMREIRGNRIAMIFQAAMNSLNPVQRVGDQIVEAIQIHDPEIPRVKAMEDVKQLFREVGLAPERMLDFPHQYSGGMKQRAIIAMAMACRPALIIADEPTTALDMVVQRQILMKIAEIQKEHSIAILMISHDLGVISDLCHDIAIMANGEIIEYGSREEILGSPAHPYTRMLMDSYLSLERDTKLPEFIPKPVCDRVEASIPGCSCYQSCSHRNDHCRIHAPQWRTLSPTHKVRCSC